MNSIRTSEKALERIRSSGSFPTHAAPDKMPVRRGGAGGWLGGMVGDGNPASIRRERSRTAEITLGEDSDEEDRRGGSVGTSPAAGSVADDKLRELNAAGLAALVSGDTARAKQVLEDALAAVKRGGIKDVGLAAGTYGNYGTMLLAVGKNTDKAVDMLADAVVRISRVPPDVQSNDLDQSLKNMRAVLTSALEKNSDGDIRLEVISQYAAGAQMERERKGFECLEHLRIANDLSKTCMGAGHPAHKAISGSFDRAKKAYSAGATTFQSKKVQAQQKKSVGKGEQMSVKGGGADEEDFLGGTDGGLGLFEKGLSNDVWLAMKNGGKCKSKGMRVNAGTAAKASLADRNLSSREGSRGISRGANREPSPDLFANAGAAKKSSFLANLLGNDPPDEAPSSKMPSIAQKPGSQKKPPKPAPSASKQMAAKKDGKVLRRPLSPVQQPQLSEGQPHVTQACGTRQAGVPTPKEAQVQAGRGELQEIRVPVPVTKNAPTGRLKTPSRTISSSGGRNAVDRSKAASAASSASTKADKGSKERSPLAAPVDSDDESSELSHLRLDEPQDSLAVGELDSSIDDIIGELGIWEGSLSPKQLSPTAQQVLEDSDDDDAPRFVTVAQHDAEAEAHKKHLAAASDAADFARAKLESGDLVAAREAMVAAGKEWLAAGVDRRSELATLAATLATGLAREMIRSGDLAGAKAAVVSAASEWKKAGENRTGELAGLEADIAEAAVKLGRVEEAADIYTSALEVAEEAGDVEAQAAAYGKLANAYKLLGRNDEAIQVLTKSLELAQLNEDGARQVAAYEALGDAYTALGRSQEAISVLSKSLELAEKTWDVAGQGRAQRGLGVALISLGRHTEAADMFSKALEVAERTGDAAGINAASKGLGAVYTTLGQYDEAVTTLKKTMEIALRSADPAQQSAALQALGLALTALGQNEEYVDGEKTRATLQHYDEAIEMHSRALEIAEQSNDVALQSDICSGLAKTVCVCVRVCVRVCVFVCVCLYVYVCVCAAPLSLSLFLK